jgi:uncharacterized protein
MPLTKITKKNLDSIAVGAELLGSGGGGCTKDNLSILKNIVNKDIEIISVKDLNDNDLILPVALMGAPIIAKEKILNTVIFNSLIQEFEKHYKVKPAALISAEIGGSNALFPLILSSMTGIPIIDGDLIGRAFPELQMTVANLKGIKKTTALLTNCQGESYAIFDQDIHCIETKAREVTVKWGSSAAIALYIMKKKTALETVLKNTLSQAFDLGNIMLNRNNSITKLIEITKGHVVCSGRVEDISQNIKAGFLMGNAIILEKQSSYCVRFQNEYMEVTKNEVYIARTPDIISVLDSESLLPISSENLSYGTKVIVIAFKADKMWYSESGLRLSRYYKFQGGQGS